MMEEATYVERCHVALLEDSISISCSKMGYIKVCMETKTMLQEWTAWPNGALVCLGVLNAVHLWSCSGLSGHALIRA